ncbi:MAG TPA: TIGR03435 family protein [Acidobacteriaceae bacterium]|nr:TIGR03435 family protein [Acidobacteriaceae bacterium]
MAAKLSLVALIAISVLAGASRGRAQDQSAPIVEKPAVPSFEVATIRPDSSTYGGSSGLSHGRFLATDVTIRGLLRFEAFDIPDARIVGGPKWMDSARFDFEAKLDPNDASRIDSLAPSQRNEMKETLVQKLLAERFQFKFHWEQRELPVYALTSAKGGPKLKPAADAKRGPQWSLGSGKLQCKDVTLSQLADLFTQAASNELGRVVVDRTGVPGAFDLNLSWAPDTGASASNTPAGPSLFTAVQEQLGLKLESAKAPVKVLVVDQLEMPSEN